MPFDPSKPPVIFGEALFDCFPDGTQVLGGAPFNVAWHLASFGAAPVFISSVGNDVRGDQLEQAMANRGMSRLGLQRDPVHGTGSVQVTLTEGEPSYEIVADRAYDHIEAAALPSPPARALLYHGSLALRGEVSTAALHALREQTDASVFLDVNLRDPWWDKQRLKAMLDGATWAKLNADELLLLAPDGATMEERARLPLQQALDRAQSFASAMVGQRGATVDDRDFYTTFTCAWDI